MYAHERSEKGMKFSMNKLKPIIQDASDRMNDSILNSQDNMQGIKEIVAIDRRAIEAISAYKAHQENIVESGNKATPIITADEIRKDMEEQYRPMVKREEKSDELEK